MNRQNGIKERGARLAVARLITIPLLFSIREPHFPDLYFRYLFVIRMEVWNKTLYYTTIGLFPRKKPL